jgi:hypothetical protein
MSEHRDNTSEKRTAVGKALERLRGVWPWRDPESEEVVRVLMGRKDKWEVADLRAGVDALISDWGSQSGSWPKPYDVAGYVMKAVRDRSGGQVVRDARAYAKQSITFSEWWETVPESERTRHRAIHGMFARNEDPPPEAPPTVDVIEW